MAQSKGNGAMTANVGPEGKSKRSLVCFEQVSAEQNVGPVGNGNGECNDDGLDNGISSSNGICFSDEMFQDELQARFMSTILFRRYIFQS